MYDQATHSEWLHMDGTAFHGKLAGTRLKTFPSRHVRWGEWKRDHPTTDVMVPLKTARYPHRSTAIRGYSVLPSTMAEKLVDVSNALDINELVYGVEHGGQTVAYPVRSWHATAEPVLNEEVAGEPIVVGLNPNTRSPFAYHRTLNGDVLKFRWQEDGTMLELTTGSRFSEAGVGLDGSLRGQQLVPLSGSMQSAWYGWYSSRPTTKIHSFTPKDQP